MFRPRCVPTRGVRCPLRRDVRCRHVFFRVRLDSSASSFPRRGLFLRLRGDRGSLLSSLGGHLSSARLWDPVTRTTICAARTILKSQYFNIEMSSFSCLAIMADSGRQGDARLRLHFSRGFSSSSGPPRAPSRAAPRRGSCPAELLGSGD